MFQEYFSPWIEVRPGSHVIFELIANEDLVFWSEFGFIGQDIDQSQHLNRRRLPDLYTRPIFPQSMFGLTVAFHYN